MKKLLLSAALFTSSLCLGFSQSTFTLLTAITEALNSNYDIKKQQYAVAQAESQLRQVQGNLDFEIGAQVDYAGTNRPVDPQDPNYSYGYSFSNPDNPSGIFLSNTYLEQMNGSVYLKKLFSIGLEAKLSYTIKREENSPKYKYSNFYDQSKYKQEKARNTGDINLEVSLPLFKSFKNSLVALQIDNASATLDQMKSNLRDTISQTIIQTSKDFWNYYIACDNLKQLEILQEKAEKRYSNTKELKAAGMRSNTDLLTLQINTMENLREVENAKVKCADAKMKLLQDMGISDNKELGAPEFNFFRPENESPFPSPSEITEDFIKKIAETRTDIAALRHKVEAAQKKIEIARVDAFPDAKLKLNIGTTGTKYSNDIDDTMDAPFWNIKGVNWGGSISVAIKPGNNTKRGVIDQNYSEYNTALNEYNKALNVLATQIRNVAESLEVYTKNVKNADEVLQLQGKVYENQEYLFSTGFINADKLIEQDQKYINAKQNYYRILSDYMGGVLQFKYLTAEMIDVVVDPQFSGL